SCAAAASRLCWVLSTPGWRKATGATVGATSGVLAVVVASPSTSASKWYLEKSCGMSGKTKDNGGAIGART
nr:hypothetical protein [Tanacetum cinerariifolium]